MPIYEYSCGKCRKIVDVRWGQCHDDEVAAMLVLDNGETVRGPVLGEYNGGTGFN